MSSQPVDNQLRIHVNTDGVVEFSVALNDSVDPSMVATMVAAVRRGIVTSNTPNPSNSSKRATTAVTTKSTTTATTVHPPLSNHRTAQPPNASAAILPNGHVHPTQLPHTHPSSLQSPLPSPSKRPSVQLPPVQTHARQSQPPLPRPPLATQSPLKRDSSHHPADRCIYSILPASSANDDRVPSPLVQHPERNLSVRQIAAEFESRPSVEAEVSLVTSSVVPTFTQFEPAREFSSSPALWQTTQSSNALDASCDRLRTHRSGHSSAHLVTPECVTAALPPTPTMHMQRPRSTTMPSDTAIPHRVSATPPRMVHSDRASFAERPQPPEVTSPKPPRVHSMPTGPRYDLVNDGYFVVDDVSSLTGRSDAPAEFEARARPTSTHAVSPHLASGRLGSVMGSPSRLREVPTGARTTTIEVPHAGDESQAATGSSLIRHHCADEGEAEAGEAVKPDSMEPIASPMLFAEPAAGQAQSPSNMRDFSELTDSNMVQRDDENNGLLGTGEEARSVQQGDGDVEGFDTPSASTAFVLTGPAVAAATDLTAKSGRRGKSGKNVPSAVEARLDGEAFGQNPAGEMEEPWDNVDYVMTDPYQRDVHDSDALADRSTGADIHAPATMRVARWGFLSSIGSKMGKRRGTAVGGNSHVVEDIHQSTLAEGAPVYTEDKNSASHKGTRSYVRHIFSRHHVRNGALWLEFSSPLTVERMLSEVGKIAKSLGYQVWRRPGENKLRCIRRLSHRHEMHMVIVVGSIGLPDGPVTVVRLRRARGDRNRTEAWRYAHFYRDLIERLQRCNIEISGGE